MESKVSEKVKKGLVGEATKRPMKSLCWKAGKILNKVTKRKALVEINPAFAMRHVGELWSEETKTFETQS